MKVNLHPINQGATSLAEWRSPAVPRLERPGNETAASSTRQPALGRLDERRQFKRRNHMRFTISLALAAAFVAIGLGATQPANAKKAATPADGFSIHVTAPHMRE